MLTMLSDATKLPSFGFAFFILIIIAINHQICNAVQYRSHISTFMLSDKTTRVLYTGNDVWEAPNWSPDGSNILVNSNGKLYRINVGAFTSTVPRIIDVGSDMSCNNDKTYSPHGNQIAFSASNITAQTNSQIFIANSDGTDRQLIVSEYPSYFHSWSPDGVWLSFVAQRNGTFNLFRVNASTTGGEQEERLTSAHAYDDGPDYSVDGKWIYFNSNRTGSYDIWRMPANGAGIDDSNAQIVTNDTLEDWFPHPSPDGKFIVFLSFPSGTAGHNDRMSGMQLRLLELSNGDVKNSSSIVSLHTFFGGQGSINVNSWSPHSDRFAFVSFEEI